MRTPTGDRPFPTVSVLCATFYVLAPIVVVLGGYRAGLVMTAIVALTIAVIVMRRRCR